MIIIRRLVCFYALFLYIFCMGEYLLESVATPISVLEHLEISTISAA
jgi:hypothetical protein